MKSIVSILILAFGISANAETGVYWVPVPKELSRFAVFNMEAIDVRQTGNELTLSYVLPFELTGNFYPMEFTGPLPSAGQPLVLTGTHGTVSCPSAEDLSMCETNYVGLNFNVAARSKHLSDISRTPTELEMREAVALSFCAGRAVMQAVVADGIKMGAFTPMAVALGGEPCGFLRVNSY